MRSHLTLAVVASAFLIVSSADASGLSTARFGGEFGNPITTNPTAIYYNPGAIGLSKGVNVYIDGNFAYRLATFERAEVCPSADTPTGCDARAQEFGETPSSVGANYGKAALSNFVAAPMLGATAKFPVADDIDIGAGAAFFVPFGGASSWNKNEAFNGHPQFPGPSDGVQRWWSIDGTLRSMFISGALSVSLSELVHIGASAGLALSEVNTIRAKTLTNTNSLAQEGRALINASDVNIQAGGGIAVTPLRNNDLRIGFSYQMPVGVNGITMQGPLTVHDGINDNQPQEVDLHMVWPDIFRLGVAYKPTDALELRLFGDVTRWNLFEDQCIAVANETDGCRKKDGTLQDGVLINLPRNWNVGAGVRAGVSYWFSETVEVFGGAGYDNSAIPDETLEPALLDFDDISLTAGGRFGVTDWLSLQASYTHLFYIARDTTDTNKLSAFEGNSTGPDAGGQYSQTIGVFNLGLQVHFDPFSSDDEPEGAPPVSETNRLGADGSGAAQTPAQQAPAQQAPAQATPVPAEGATADGAPSQSSPTEGEPDDGSKRWKPAGDAPAEEAPPPEEAPPEETPPKDG